MTQHFGPGRLCLIQSVFESWRSEIKGCALPDVRSALFMDQLKDRRFKKRVLTPGLLSMFITIDPRHQSTQSWHLQDHAYIRYGLVQFCRDIRKSSCSHGKYLDL